MAATKKKSTRKVDAKPVHVAPGAAFDMQLHVQEAYLLFLYLGGMLGALHDELGREPFRVYMENADNLLKHSADMDGRLSEFCAANPLWLRHHEFWRMIRGPLGAAVDARQKTSPQTKAEFLVRASWFIVRNPSHSGMGRIVAWAAMTRDDGWLGYTDEAGKGDAFLRFSNSASVSEVATQVRKLANEAFRDDTVRVARVFSALGAGAKLDPAPDAKRTEGGGRPRGRLLGLISAAAQNDLWGSLFADHLSKFAEMGSRGGTRRRPRPSH